MIRTDDLFGNIFEPIIQPSPAMQRYIKELHAYCALPEAERLTTQKPINPLHLNRVFTDQELMALSAKLRALDL